jgi:hypothetical protein
VEERHLDLLAASLRADTSDTRALMEALAAKLEEALPGETVVARKAAGLLSRHKRVERITVTLDQDTFTVSIAGESAKAARSKTVGGIAIRNEPLPLDDWLSSLTAALEDQAKRSEAARIALQRLLG